MCSNGSTGRSLTGARVIWQSSRAVRFVCSAGNRRVVASVTRALIAAGIRQPERARVFTVFTLAPAAKRAFRCSSARGVHSARLYCCVIQRRDWTDWTDELPGGSDRERRRAHRRARRLRAFRLRTERVCLKLTSLKRSRCARGGARA